MLRLTTLLEWLYTFQKEESDPDVKVLVFTEFVPTQQMLSEFLTNHGISVACLNGSMNMEQRQQVQEAFAKESDLGGGRFPLRTANALVFAEIRYFYFLRSRQHGGTRYWSTSGRRSQ